MASFKVALPPWVNWTAIDANGRAYGYQRKPEIDEDNACWDETTDGDVFQINAHHEARANAKWRESLRYVGDK